MFNTLGLLCVFPRQFLSLSNEVLHPGKEFLAHLDGNDMALPLDQMCRNAPLFPAQSFDQDGAVWKGDHSVSSTVDDLDALATHAVGELFELL